MRWVEWGRAAKLSDMMCSCGALCGDLRGGGEKGVAVKGSACRAQGVRILLPLMEPPLLPPAPLLTCSSKRCQAAPSLRHHPRTHPSLPPRTRLSELGVATQCP